MENTTEDRAPTPAPQPPPTAPQDPRVSAGQGTSAQLPPTPGTTPPAPQQAPSLPQAGGYPGSYSGPQAPTQPLSSWPQNPTGPQQGQGPVAPAWAAPRPPAPQLTRSQSDRVLGGVLGGLARYWNTDPLLLRILTVVLTIATGGALLIGYLIAWLAIPLETSPTGQPAGTGYAAGGSPGYGNPGYGTPGYGGPGYPDLPDTAAPPAGPRPPRSYLGWLVLSAALLLIGVLALIGVLTDPTSGFIALVCSAVLILLGAGMVAGAWYGRARWLAVVAVPMVFVTMGAVATHDWVNSPEVDGWFTSADGGISVGSRVWTVTPDELTTGQPLDYQVTVGDAVLDLTALTGTSTQDSVAITAGVALGELVVIIPADMRLELDASVRAGQISVPGPLPGQVLPERSGTDLDVQTLIDPPTGQPAYVVTLDVTMGAGNLEVRRASA